MKLGESILVVSLLTLVPVSGCAAHRGTPVSAERQVATASAPEPTSGSITPGAPPGAAAFAVDGRVEAGGKSRRLRLRVFAEPPDRFRIEASGAVGGVALVATGSGAKARVVLPSRRVYSEVPLDSDLGSDLLGLPVTGCDIAMVLRISAGLRKFQPCGGTDTDPDAPPPPRDQRPGLIVDTTPTGRQTMAIGFDWRGEGLFPQEVRIESTGENPMILALTRFRALAWPGMEDPGLFWEPLPPGATRVAPGGLSGDEAR